jgi:hypothetical protein
MFSGSTDQVYHKSPKDYTPWVVAGAIILIFGMVTLGFWISPEPLDKTPRLGDVWEFYGTGNPFKEDEKYTREVIKIEKGYIQFIENRSDTLSRRIPVFIFNSELISRKTPKKVELDTIKINEQPIKRIVKDTATVEIPKDTIK